MEGGLWGWEEELSTGGTVFFLWPKGRGLETGFLGVLVCFPVVGVKCPDKSHLRQKGLTQLIAPDCSPSWGKGEGEGGVTAGV